MLSEFAYVRGVEVVASWKDGLRGRLWFNQFRVQPSLGPFAIAPRCNSRGAPSARAGAAQQVTNHCASEGRRELWAEVGDGIRR